MTDPTALAPCEEVSRLLTMFDELGKLDVAEAITFAGGDAECVDPDYPPDDADQAVELADPVLVAEVNATLGYLAEHGPAVAEAFVTFARLNSRLYEVVADTFGSDVEDAVVDGLRVSQRLRAAYALIDHVTDRYPSNLVEPL